MKIRWISTIVLIVTLLAVPGVGYGIDEQLCQPAVVFFGNGVWNDAEDANESSDLLEDELEIHTSGTNLEGTIKYKISYNPSEGALEDLLETFEQIIQTNYSNFWRYLAGLELMPDFLQDKLKEIANEVDENIVSANPSVQEHIAVYDNYLREGNVVVLVAHSQGNLYGYIAYRGIDPQYIDGFGIVSVATPASDITVNEPWPYTTIDEDQIIASIPFAPSSNLNNFFGPINLNDWSGHKFIESYMASGHDAETVILDNVINMFNDLGFSNNNTTAIFVADPAFTTTTGEYDSAVVSVTLDPAKINWIAWNNTPHVEKTDPSRPGEFFLFGGGIGTDDYIMLTVVAPSGASQTINIDQNNAWGGSFGTQNVIFGSASDAPDVFRNSPGILDEGGSHNAIFTETGSYTFQFSFRNVWGPGAHGNIYLLINQCQ